jgi:multiple sugar transport system permease protein
LDGAGFFRVFALIILPIARPGLAACAVVTFILVWNEFLFILVLAGNRLVTIPMTIASFQTDKQILWSSIAASSVISLIPILLLIAFAHRHLLSGLGLGAVRE